MEVVICEKNRKEEWDEYVLSKLDGNFHYSFVLKEIIEVSYHHRCYYLMALSGGKITGILPLTHIKNFIFGNFMVSIPFFGYGGIRADSKEAQNALLEEAAILASQLKASYIEIRTHNKLDFNSNLNSNLNLAVVEDKVSFHLHLPENHEELWKSIKSKVRSQIRRPEKEGEVVFKSGGEELLNNFYHVFSLNLQKLGTPVHSKVFFSNIFKYCPQKTRIRIFILYLKGNIVSVGFTIGDKNTLEMAWASSKEEYRKYGVNMCFYWNALKQACIDGYKIFDFGRSTIGQGTFNFKKQWETEIVPAYWYYYSENNKIKIPQLNQNSSKYRLAATLWAKLPLKATKIIGPHIRRNIP